LSLSRLDAVFDGVAGPARGQVVIALDAPGVVGVDAQGAVPGPVVTGEVGGPQASEVQLQRLAVVGHERVPADEATTGVPPAAGLVNAEVAALAELKDGDEQRHPNPDEDILDRAGFLAQVTGRTVGVITADRGMRVRATGRDGLRAILMPERYSRDQPTGAG
jgi:hypothetical protein